MGVIYQSRSGNNLFFSLSGTLLGSFAQVAAAPTDNAKLIISGPTEHGLALASMLTIALPFAVLPLLEARRPSERLKYLVIIGLILAADFSTHEKTGTFAPIAAFLVLAAYKRQILRWMPLAIIVLIPVIHFASPGALGGIGEILPTSHSQADYSDGRAYDYPAVAPDILNNLILGRGYGTMNTQNWRIYRILDNQYLGTLFEVGVIGLISYLAIVVFGMVTAHGVIRRGGVRAPPALAASAGCAAFGLLSATYDAAAFPQAVYSFLFVAALVAVVASKKARPQRQPEPPCTRGAHRGGSAPRLRRFILPASPRRGSEGLTCPLCLQMAPDLTARRTPGAARNDGAPAAATAHRDRQNVRPAEPACPATHMRLDVRPPGPKGSVGIEDARVPV